MPESLANEWTELIEDWSRNQPEVRPEVLRARIDRERRRMVWMVAGEVALSVVVCAGAVYALVRFPSDWTRMLALDIALILAATWAFAIWNRRGIWRPLGETTDAFIRLARLRCRRKLQALRFAMVVFVAQLVFVGVWRAWGLGDAPFVRTNALTAVPILVVVVFVGVLIHARRRATEELAELDRIGVRVD